MLLPGGAEHVLASDPEALARTTEQVFDPWERTGEGVVRIGTGPVRTHVLCAHYDHDPVVTTQVRDAGRLVRTQRFDGAAQAMAARFETEVEFRDRSEVEIVALTAASEDDLRRTHGRYFLGLGDLAARMK